MPAYTIKITAAGLAAAIASDALGLSLHLTHVALGAGAYNPTGSETALADRRETVTVAPGSRGGPTQITVNALFPSALYTGAAYNIGEVGYFAGDPAAGGTLFIVVSASGLSLGSRSAGGVDFDASCQFNLSGVPSGSVTVTIDTAAGLSHLLLSDHEAAANPHPQYVRKAGDTMTGPLVLYGDAAAALQAVPKQQLDAAINAEATTRYDDDQLRLLKSGGTMTGPLVLAGNAASALQAVPKQQLDAAIGPTSQVFIFSGSVSVPDTPWTDILTTGAITVSNTGHLVFDYSADTVDGVDTTTIPGSSLAVPVKFRIRRSDGAIASGAIASSVRGMLQMAYAAGYTYKLQAQLVGPATTNGAVSLATLLVHATSN
jgi:hypothetical protein